MSRNRISGAMFTVLVVKVARESLAETASGITDQVRTSPNFYRHAPVVLDISAASQLRTADDYRALRDVVEAHNLIPVGIQGGSPQQRQVALSCGLASFPVSTPGAGRGERQRESSGSRTRLVTQTVRSGSQIYVKGGDLIVAASVSPGAEVIADGHVHIYGTLRGRALAGAAGDPEARIFCRSLEAELLSVAGHYLVREDIEDSVQGKTVTVLLDGDRLVIREDQ